MKLLIRASVVEHTNIPFLDEDEDKVNHLSEIEENEEASEGEVGQPI